MKRFEHRRAIRVGSVVDHFGGRHYNAGGLNFGPCRCIAGIGKNVTVVEEVTSGCCRK